MSTSENDEPSNVSLTSLTYRSRMAHASLTYGSRIAQAWLTYGSRIAHADGATIRKVGVIDALLPLQSLGLRTVDGRGVDSIQRGAKRNDECFPRGDDAARRIRANPSNAFVKPAVPGEHDSKRGGAETAAFAAFGPLPGPVRSVVRSVVRAFRSRALRSKVPACRSFTSSR